MGIRLQTACGALWTRRCAGARYSWPTTEEHHITPHSVEKSIRNVLEISRSAHKDRKDSVQLTPQQRQMKIQLMEQEMKQAAAELDFERAAVLRDEILALRDGTVPDRKKQKKSSGYKGRKKGK